jgi:allantoin racemase
VTAVRIAIINPNTTESMTDTVVAFAREVAGDDTVLIGVTPTTGAASIESHADEVRGARSVLEEVQRLEVSTDRPDAYVIACFGDTGVAAAKEVATGPVVGMTEAALLTAAILVHRFTIVTMPPETIEFSDRVVRSLGLGHRVTVRAVDEPVGAIANGSLHLLDDFLAESRLAIAEDGAEAIVVGCAGLADLVRPLREALGIPVIEGVAAAVGIAKSLVAQGHGVS